MESTSVVDLQQTFLSIHDPRVLARCKHRLTDVLVMAVCAMIGGADDWENIAHFVRARRAFFELLLGLDNDTPSADTFSRVFSLIDPKQFEQPYQQWITQSLSDGGMKHLAIDGKTIRRSHNRRRGEPPLHIVSAYASEAGLVLTQEKIEEKSNEITAIPAVLDRLNLENCTVTIDAMGCQKSIVNQIVERGGDFVIGLKGNQPTLASEVEAQFQQWLSCNFRGAAVDHFEHSEKNRGREEVRRVWCTEDLSQMPKSLEWPNIRSVALVESERREGEVEPVEQRYYVSSCPADAKILCKVIRSHWAIENSVHWVLDMTFREDESRVRDRVSAENLSLLRKIALNTVRSDKTRSCSMSSKRKIAGWDENYLTTLLKSLIF